MRTPPDNALLPGKVGHHTVPPIAGRIPVQVRIVRHGVSRWVDATAHAWSRESVCVWWSDGDHLQRIDWLASTDVRRTSTGDSDPPR